MTLASTGAVFIIVVSAHYELYFTDFITAQVEMSTNDVSSTSSRYVTPGFNAGELASPPAPPAARGFRESASKPPSLDGRYWEGPISRHYSAMRVFIKLSCQFACAI